MLNMSPVDFVEQVLNAEVNDRTLCIGYSFFGYFMVGYASIGGLGMAIYRVLYVKVGLMS